MSKRNIHTIYDPEKKVWKTVLEGQEKPLATSKTKAAAEKKSITKIILTRFCGWDDFLFDPASRDRKLERYGPLLRI